MKHEELLDDGTKYVRITDDKTDQLVQEIFESTEGETIRRYFSDGKLTKSVTVTDGIEERTWFDRNEQPRKRVTKKHGMIHTEERLEGGVWIKGKATDDSKLRSIKQQRNKETGGITAVAPAIRTNAIPGQKSRETYCEQTGMEFTSRAKYEKHLEDNGLVELSGKYDYFSAPSEASYPTRPKGAVVGSNGTIWSGIDDNSQDPATLAQQLKQDLAAGKIEDFSKTAKAAQRREYRKNERERLKRSTGL